MKVAQSHYAQSTHSWDIFSLSRLHFKNVVRLYDKKLLSPSFVVSFFECQGTFVNQIVLSQKTLNLEV